MIKVRKIFCLIMVLVMTLSVLSISAYAVEARSSNYLASYGADAIAIGSGKIKVDFDVSATDKMTKLGTSVIYIYQSNGMLMKTFNSSAYSNMLGSNCSSYTDNITYSGTVGVSYYAVVVFYASDSNGSDTKTVTTDTVTAR